ncbi:uncharacterized protein B0J16DRAFT_317477 [Fusarium flagelliforme]|uniref:Uncharacterized protein n=1 Tax=Fusarium flagelliforme TaxID=2675880 RepID=A0A395MEB4_9HYPO|nr:uncharacterized protein B0J16DRAFT_317477 [Fusarium flagelliforme]KAH7193817.1 hypothetical protein B0J16DRAFT_317477 [Fusarium flagelliforme]RFN46160.1 hypothetical protein FIE12Z_9578 [Fusarium flagelliforme]
MTRSRGNKDMTVKPLTILGLSSGLSHQGYQTNNLGLVDVSCIDPRLLLNTTDISNFSLSPSAITAPQPEIGNGQTSVGATMHQGSFQPRPNPKQHNNQGHIMLTPCVGCTRRMAKVKTNDQNSMNKAHPCHRQSTRGTKACSACRKGGRRCIWIKEPVLKDIAMSIQWGLQRVKERGGDYTEQENQHCDWILEELEQKYPPHGGVNHR